MEKLETKVQRQPSSEMLEATILAFLEEKKYTDLRALFLSINPADIAYSFGILPVEQLPLLFRLLPKELAAETFVEMDAEEQALLIRSFSDSQLKDVVNEMYVDDAVDLVEEMPANVVRRILRQVNPEMRKSINELLKYPEDSAGSIMTTEFVDLRPNMTVEEAIKRIRRIGVDKETIYTCYVIDSNRTLVGLVSVRTLLLAEESDIIADIMETNVISAGTLDDQEEVAQKLTKYDFLAIPVVDGEGRLVGIITFDDAFDVLQEEVTEDIEKMAAITPSDKPYMRTGVFEIWSKRIPWLLILMISATFTSMILTTYEHALAAHVVLTAFIPMLMDTGGNSGSQASATIIRGLALTEIRFSDLFKVLSKEFRVALLCGITLSSATYLKLVFFDRVGVEVALVVSLTLICTIFFAKLVGCSLPMFAKKIGFDPAVMASPFITTIVDALSLLIYFQMASLLLHI